MPLNIAVVGQFAAGKTTIANALIEEYCYTRLMLANGIKQMAARLYNGGDPVAKNGYYDVTDVAGDPLKLSGREVLQELGQVVKSFDRDFWLRWLEADMRENEGPFVIDDCRFPFEADYLRERGWVIVKVETPNLIRMKRYEKTYGRMPTETELNHPSETEVPLIVPDLRVDGTIPAIASARQAFKVAML